MSKSLLPAAATTIPTGERDLDAWRKRCPKGHADWECASDGYYCNSCERPFDRLTTLHRVDSPWSPGV